MTNFLYLHMSSIRHTNLQKSVLPEHPRSTWSFLQNVTCLLFSLGSFLVVDLVMGTIDYFTDFRCKEMHYLCVGYNVDIKTLWLNLWYV